MKSLNFPMIRYRRRMSVPSSTRVVRTGTEVAVLVLVLDTLGDDDLLATLLVNLDALFKEGHPCVERKYPLKGPKGDQSTNFGDHPSPSTRHRPPIRLYRSLHPRRRARFLCGGWLAGKLTLHFEFVRDTRLMEMVQNINNHAKEKGRALKVPIPAAHPSRARTCAPGG
eukprot:2876117-Pyramimonas_sp.AAC.1